MSFIVGVDVGGTFTDVFVWDEAARRVTTAKVPSTRGDQSRGFAEGIRQCVGDFADIATVVHGTTVSRLEFVLRRAGIRALVFGGIVTNGGVASTVRDAHVRDLDCVVLSDGCAAFRPEVHETSIADLSTIATVMTCAEAQRWIAG